MSMSTDTGTEINTGINAGMQNSHISNSQLEALISGKIADEDFIMLLEHAGQCTFCAERLGEAVEAGMMSIMPPAYLKDQIREQAEHIDVAVGKKARQTSKHIQLLFYSFRVAVTVLLAVVMLCMTSAFPMTDMTKVEAARLKRYQEKIERDEENLATEYSGMDFCDDNGSLKDFIKDNLYEVIGDLLDYKNKD